MVPVSARLERLAKHRVKQDARSLGPDRNLDPAVAALGADIEPASANQRVPGEQRKVEQKLDRALGQLLVLDHPAELDPPLGPEQPLERHLGFTRVDLFAETAPGAEGEPEELELVGRRPRAVASSSRHFSRISGSVSSASSSIPLLSAPTGDMRSWQSREQRRLARSTAIHRT